MAVKLTIGTAVYNVGENFLRLHIEGVKKQLTDDVEFLLIDDCSTDNSGEICREYANTDSRIKYINMGQNSGLSGVRNRTISEANGTWIFFADGDDLISDNFVKTALSFYDEDYDIIVHDRAVFSEEKGAEQDCAVTELSEVPKGAGRELSLSCLSIKPIDLKAYGMSNSVFYHAAWGAIYSRDFLLNNNLKFPEGQKKAQDSVFNTYAYFYAEKIAYLPYTMYYYRKNMQGITKRYSADFTEMARSLISHHYDCMKNLYPDDKEVEDIYKKYRVISLTLDSMKLNFFHKDNPNPKNVRKEGFMDFINSEPFKSAVDDFDLESCDWWGWRLPIEFAKKRNFGMLDFAFKHGFLFSLYGKASSVIRKLK
ncbi:MAG: glycosyltransferase [Firmicutes bacterium]|nr:glycosyltransferase [Bacillota bacterium]